LYGSCFL